MSKRQGTGLKKVADIIAASNVVKQATSLTPHITGLLDAAAWTRSHRGEHARPLVSGGGRGGDGHAGAFPPSCES